MKIETGKTIYRCEVCRKHFHRERSAIRHEQLCQCKWCVHFDHDIEIVGYGGRPEGRTVGCVLLEWELGSEEVNIEYPCPHRKLVPSCPVCGWMLSRGPNGCDRCGWERKTKA